jgi:hypothetical protein
MIKKRLLSSQFRNLQGFKKMFFYEKKKKTMKGLECTLDNTLVK